MTWSMRWPRCASSALAGSLSLQVGPWLCCPSWEAGIRASFAALTLPLLPACLPGCALAAWGTAVAGEDAVSIQPTLRKMKASGVRAILDYAAVECMGQDSYLMEQGAERGA